MSKTLAIFFRIKDKKIKTTVTDIKFMCQSGHQVYGGANFCPDCGAVVEKVKKDRTEEIVITTRDVVKFLDELQYYSMSELNTVYTDDLTDNCPRVELLKRLKALPNYSVNISLLNFLEKNYFHLSDFILPPDGNDMDELVLAISADELKLDLKTLSVEVKDKEKFAKTIYGVERFFGDMGFKFTMKADVFNYENEYNW